MRNRIRKLIHNAMWVPFGSRSGYFIGCARFCFLSGSDQVSLNVYFNAAPLLSPKTGIGQYCLNLMSELENISDVEPHYFYGGVWSDELLRQAPTSVTCDEESQAHGCASNSRSRVWTSTALARTPLLQGHCLDRICGLSRAELSGIPYPIADRRDHPRFVDPAISGNTSQRSRRVHDQATR